MPKTWSAELVEVRLIGCLDCVSRLPMSGVASLMSAWPPHSYDDGDYGGHWEDDEDFVPKEIPTALEISLMEESITWILTYLKHDENLSKAAGLFIRKKRQNLSRAAIEGVGGEGWSNYQITRKARIGLQIIADGLNEDGVTVR